MPAILKGAKVPGSQINWGHPLTRSLAGCWLMNEGAGTQVADALGQNHLDFVGAIGTSVKWSPSMIGKGVAISAVDNGLQLLTPTPALMPTEEATLAWWSVFNGSPSSLAVVGMNHSTADSPPYTAFGFQVDNPGVIKLIQNTGGTYDGGLSVSNAWVAGEPHVWVGTLRSGQQVLYRDGLSIGSLGKTGSLVYGATAFLGVGEHPAWSRNLNATTFMLAIWRRALSAGEAALFSANPLGVLATPSWRKYAFASQPPPPLPPPTHALQGYRTIYRPNILGKW